MKFKLLNGDIISMDCRIHNILSIDQHTAYVLKALLSTELSVMEEQIRLVLPDENDSIDALVLVLPYGYVDMRGVLVDWSEIPKHVLHKLCKHPDIAREINRNRDEIFEYCVFSETTESTDQNVQTILDNIDTFKCRDGFCLNEDDRILDWLFDHPEYISFPQFLANSNPRAVEYSIQWLLPRYETLEEMFNFNPDVFELYLMYLSRNTNHKMFWCVWRGCPYLKPKTPQDILLRVCHIPDIEIVFRDDTKWF